IASNITAPITPAIMEDIHPPPPAPPPMPRRLRSQPPRTAPTMPMMIVTIIPPGSGPGMIHLASAPAMSPTMIQNIKADIISYQHSLPCCTALLTMLVVHFSCLRSEEEPTPPAPLLLLLRPRNRRLCLFGGCVSSVAEPGSPIGAPVLMPYNDP